MVRILPIYAEKGRIWTSSVNSKDEIKLPDGRKKASNQATIWRWREAYQHDFTARMDWNISPDFKKANHNPVLTLNGNTGKTVAKAVLKPGEKVQLSAKGSSDPDGDKLRFNWFVYLEAGGFNGNFSLVDSSSEEITFAMPALKEGQSLHIVPEV